MELNSSYSDFDETLTGVHKDLYWVHCIYTCDLFYYIDNLAMTKNGDDCSLYTFSPALDPTLKKRLKNCNIKVFEWFNKNRFRSNVDKCNLITIWKSQEEIQIEETSVKGRK